MVPEATVRDRCSHGGETALITGASAGIGRELARVFARHGFGLVLVARSQEKLEALARDLALEHAIRADAIAMDLGKPDAPARLFDDVARLGRRVDVFVNDAGLMEFGAFATTEPDRLAGMIALNVGATTALTRLFLEPMLQAGRGRVLNLASLASFLPLPSVAVYAATKAYILSLSEALSEELRGTGVSVTVCAPGFTDTHMAHQIEGIDRLVGIAPLWDPAQIAREAYDACMAGEVMNVPGVANRVAVHLLALQPRWLLRRLSGAVARRLL
jgi:short-subunit dehydrogenase